MPPPVPTWRWGVVWFFFAATLLNYADRLALNSTQRFLLPEFAATDEDQKRLYAILSAAFGYSFGLGQLLAGFLVDRYSLRRLYAAAILVWSLAGALTGLVPVGMVAALVGCRVMLGLGEAFNWPCAVAGIRRLIPRESRGLANGIFHGGATLGAILTPLVVLVAVDQSTGAGWRGVFVAVGSAGAVWAAVWLGFTRGDRATTVDAVPTPDSGRDPDLKAILAGRLFWISVVAGCGINLAWHLTNTWFPLHLRQDLGVGPGTDLVLFAGFFVAADLGSLGAGALSRWLARTGWRVGRARQLVMTTLALGSLVSGLVLWLTPNTMLAAKMAAFALLSASTVGGYSVVFALMQDVSTRHTAQVVGLAGCASWLLISATNTVISQLPGGGVPAWLFPLVGATPAAAALAVWCWPLRQTD